MVKCNPKVSERGKADMTISPTVSRLRMELRSLRKDPSSDFAAGPVNDDLLTWHFTIKGPKDTVFEGGLYHGEIYFPINYPMAPPDIVFLTPNGRFEVRKKICLTATSYHPDSWQAAWDVRTLLTSLAAFMPTEANGAIGAVEESDETRRKLALQSREWRCASCSYWVQPDEVPGERETKDGAGGKNQRDDEVTSAADEKDKMGETHTQNRTEVSTVNVSNDNELSAGSCEDELSAGSMEDELSAGSMEDELSADSMEDELSAGSMEDELSGGSGGNESSTGSIEDELSAGSIEDELSIGSDANELSIGSDSNELSVSLDEEKSTNFLNNGVTTNIIYKPVLDEYDDDDESNFFDDSENSSKENLHDYISDEYDDSFNEEANNMKEEEMKQHTIEYSELQSSLYNHHHKFIPFIDIPILVCVILIIYYTHSGLAK